MMSRLSKGTWVAAGGAIGAFLPPHFSPTFPFFRRPLAVSFSPVSPFFSHRLFAALLSLAGCLPSFPRHSSLPGSVYKNDDKLRRNCVRLPKYYEDVELLGSNLACMRQIRDRLIVFPVNFTIPSQLIVGFVHDLARGPFARRRV